MNGWQEAEWAAALAALVWLEDHPSDGPPDDVEVEFYPRRWHGGRWRPISTVTVVGDRL